MTTLVSHQLNDRVRGWLRHLWRKSTTPDDWSKDGWCDQYSVEPMLSFPRFDLSESSYALLLMGRKTPAWREVYTKILDELILRHTTFWAAVDWLTKIGPDPDRANYPRRYKGLMPKDLWGQYDVPGWTANGVEPWGLQPDPIGSDGNLFFRGFFALLLGIHRSVSGEDTWDKPFEMAGLDDQTFPWTHGKIASFLAEQWQAVPHGPHCENTKVWPYCLSAAGLGLQITDLSTGSNTHPVYDQWAEDFLRKKYLDFDARGNLRSVGMYYDPLIDRLHGAPRAFGLAPAFYILPQDRSLAETLYRCGVGSVGWDRRWLPVLNPGGQPRFLSVGLLLARELGDHTTARRLERKLGGFENGRFFAGEAGAEDDEFGFFFGYDEPWPRGQESALLMLRDLLDGEGDWWRAFNESDAEKFSAPTVVGVDYPSVGLCSAWNDSESGNLELQTYVATRNARGSATTFRVSSLPDSANVSVLRDGTPYGNWSVTGPDQIEIRTQVVDHSFQVHTGYRGNAASRAAGQGGGESSHSSRVLNRASLRPIELATAGAALAGGGGCPCCAGA
ncbi:MAG: hypothetical protein JRH10_12040 [Deltaproteobacteria bacterium]|nr:hypothetical protein [Deltaproteobacteria bacterium]